MKTTGRVVLFVAITGAGSYLLAELAGAPNEEATVKGTSDQVVIAANPAPAQVTESPAPEPVTAYTPAEPVGIQSYRGNGKEAKEFKDAKDLAPVEAGPEDALGLLPPPSFFPNVRTPAPVPLPQPPDSLSLR